MIFLPSPGLFSFLDGLCLRFRIGNPEALLWPLPGHRPSLPLQPVSLPGLPPVSPLIFSPYQPHHSLWKAWINLPASLLFPLQLYLLSPQSGIYKADRDTFLPGTCEPSKLHSPDLFTWRPALLCLPHPGLKQGFCHRGFCLCCVSACCISFNLASYVQLSGVQSKQRFLWKPFLNTAVGSKWNSQLFFLLYS